MQPDLPVISARVFEGFEAFLAAKGVALVPLLNAVGLDPEHLNDPSCDLPLKEVSAVFELASQEARDPCLGLHWAEAYAPGATGVFGYSILNADSLREAMQAVARFLSLVVHPARISYSEGPDTGVLSWHLSSLTTTSTTQYVGFSVAATTLRLRCVAGQSWQPSTVELTHRELPCTETLKRIFGPHIQFNAPINAIHTDKKSLDLKAKNRDPRIFEMMQLLGNRLLAERAGPADIVAMCQKVIVDGLSHGEVTLEAASEALDMAPRTLQAKLANSDTTFDTLLQATRKDLATGYLRESDLTMTDIALLLGFSELSAFSRATHRWFGMPPSTYRQQLRGKSVKSG
jgi:AraC-like DNA-binding protein